MESFLHANDRLGLGAEMVVVSRNPRRSLLHATHLTRDELTFVAGDVRTFDPPPGSFSHVLHCATPASQVLNDNQPMEMFDIIVEGTRRMLAVSQQRGAERFLLASSGAIYGPQPPDVLNVQEEYHGGPDVTEPRNVYGEAKRAAEMLCAIATPNPPIVIARGFAFVGPLLPLDGHFAIGNFIRDGLYGDAIVVNGNGTPLRSYLYAADLAWWLWRVLVFGEAGRAYNVGSADVSSVHQVARIVGALTQKPVLLRAQRDEAALLRSIYAPNVTRAERELGCVEHIGLAESVRRTLEWHLGAGSH